MQPLTIAVAKGRLQTDALALLARAGVSISSETLGTRRLAIYDNSGQYRFILVKPADVAVYVEHGIADCGVVGSDVVLETDTDLLQPLNLGIGRCRISVAALAETPLNKLGMLRVATKYPRVAAAHFAAKGLPVEIIKLSGAVELAPMLGLADCIVDLVETGQTLKENGLEEVESIAEATACLVVNRASYQLKAATISSLIASLAAAVDKEASSEGLVSERVRPRLPNRPVTGDIDRKDARPTQAGQNAPAPIEIIRTTEREPLARKLRAIHERNVALDDELINKVSTIIRDVRNRGDEALIQYTKLFDGVVTSPATLRVSEDALKQAAAKTDASVVIALREAIRRVRAFHENELQRSWEVKTDDGVTLGQKITPIESAGVYIPGGSAGYPSSVVMNVVPALIAGVQRIVAVTPPRSLQDNPAVATALLELGVSEIYAVGGAQAIAALAYGTETIPRVDKITGPGNRYVAAAKKLVFGVVGIDSLAGPSEVVILADGSANAAYVASDLLAQAEHSADASSVLVTTSNELASAVATELHKQSIGLPRANLIRESLAQFGAIIIVKDLHEACALVNEL
ncbi:MAG TPA: histidinol dehydrogenase, partial [Pyrinomonadaceae bacterium]